MTEWLNAPYNAYVQYSHELDSKAEKLIAKYSWFFDDSYFYWKAKKNPNIWKRCPLWLYPQKGLDGSKVEKAIKPTKSTFHEKQVLLVSLCSEQSKKEEKE